MLIDFFKSKALKKYNSISSISANSSIDNPNENELLKSLDNEFILKFLDSFQNYKHNRSLVEFCLVTEFCQVKYIFTLIKFLI